MARDDRLPPLRQLTLDNVQICPADAAGIHLYQQFVYAGYGQRNIFKIEWALFDPSRSLKDTSLHILTRLQGVGAAAISSYSSLQLSQRKEFSRPFSTARLMASLQS